MGEWKWYAAGAVGFAGLLVVLVALQPNAPGGTNPALALGSGVVAAAAAGWWQHSEDASEYDERSMHIRYRAGYVAFWAVFWFLFVFVISWIQEGESGGVAYHVPVEGYVIAAAAWVLGLVSLGVARTWYKRQY